MSVEVLQFATALAWFVVALVTSRGTYRLFFTKPMAGDPSKSGFFFTAIIFVGGSSRWLLAPDDMTTWKLVYAVSIALAVYVCIIAWNVRRDR